LPVPNDRLRFMYVALHNNQVIFGALQHREPTSWFFGLFGSPRRSQKSGRPRPTGGGSGELANTVALTHGMAREFLQAGHRRVETRLAARPRAALATRGFFPTQCVHSGPVFVAGPLAHGDRTAWLRREDSNLCIRNQFRKSLIRRFIEIGGIPSTLQTATCKSRCAGSNPPAAVSQSGLWESCPGRADFARGSGGLLPWAKVGSGTAARR